jgi:hypothetical protein
MAHQVGAGIKPESAEKLLNKLGGLREGETVWFVTNALSIRPSFNRMVITNYRTLAVDAGIGAVVRPTIVWQLTHHEVESIDGDDAKKRVKIRGARNVSFRTEAIEDVGAIKHYVNHAQSIPPPDIGDASTVASKSDTQRNAKDRQWPHTHVLGGRLSAKASLAVERLCHEGESDPWLILVPPGEFSGLLAAWHNRLAIIKTGALTGLMTGTLGGGRSTVFHFKDVTGIEYNSGIMMGVLEVLTPSYSGTANRDFWKGALQHRNADANDPYTVSNTLPLARENYRAFQDQINELRRRIADSKETTVSVSVSSPQDSVSSGVADELKKLADLRDAGVLTEDEFATAKARLLAAD